jgi:hypothetical protein
MSVYITEELARAQIRERERDGREMALRARAKAARLITPRRSRLAAGIRQLRKSTG